MGNLVDSYTPLEVAVLQSVGSFSSTLSLVSVAFTLRRIWLDNKVGTLSLATKIVGVLMVMNFGYALGTLVGRAGALDSTYCNFQAFLIQWWALGTQFWTAVMAWVMYQWMVKKKHPQRLERLVVRNCSICVLTSFLVALIVLLVDLNGPTQTWCWITQSNSDARFYAFFMWAIACWVWCIVIMTIIRTSKAANQKITSGGASGGSDYASVERSIKNKLTMYIAIFVFCWMFTLLARSIEGELSEFL